MIVEHGSRYVASGTRRTRSHAPLGNELCILSAWQSDSCTESALATANMANELIAEFISAMAATAEMPVLEDLASLDPEAFTNVN